MAGPGLQSGAGLCDRVVVAARRLKSERQVQARVQIAGEQLSGRGQRGGRQPRLHRHERRRRYQPLVGSPLAAGADAQALQVRRPGKVDRDAGPVPRPLGAGGPARHRAIVLRTWRPRGARLSWPVSFESGGDSLCGAGKINWNQPVRVAFASSVVCAGTGLPTGSGWGRIGRESRPPVKAGCWPP